MNTVGEPDGTSGDGTPGANDPAALIGDAARRTPLGRVTEEGVTGSTVLAAMGGAWGLAESVVPGILFLVLYVLTQDLWLSVGVPAVFGIVALVVRAVRRRPTAPAIGGLIGMALSSFFALRSGEGADYFILGFYTNGAYAVALLISMVIGWPVIGLIGGALTGDITGWRRNRPVRRWMQLATALWVVLFVVRLAVQLPLYFAGEVGALGVARLIMGAPLFVILVIATALLVRAVLRVGGVDERSATTR